MEGNTLEPSDYKELYRFFESRADTIKATVLSTITWMFGLASVIMGFVFSELLNSEEMARLPQPYLAVACGVGSALCVVALLVIADGKKHVDRNRGRSKRCLAKVRELEVFLDEVNRALKNERTSGGPTKTESSEPWGEWLTNAWTIMNLTVGTLLFGFIILAVWLVATGESGSKTATPPLRGRAELLITSVQLC